LKRTISLCILSLLLINPVIVRAAGSSYLNELLMKVDAKQLPADRYWEILLHYKPGGNGLKSLVDDPRFFLSPDGKRDQRAELNATIMGFFELDNNDQDHPRCRFPARYEWLKEKLDIDETRIPPVFCGKLDEALEAVAPKSAVLVFPAAHAGGPASMFGHTLLRVDSGFSSGLISHAITYAATATDTNGLLYAFKGVAGFYHGNYSILPYYEKVKEYNDMEHRDIWEYYLNLTENETRRMVLHMWELKDIYSDYYFFDENCSYNILFLLEAARPAVKLTDINITKPWIIPSDTIRDIEKSGLIQKVKYRPSIGTRIRFMASLMDKKTRALASGLSKSYIKPEEVNNPELTDMDKVRTLDLATEIIQYKYSRRELGKDEYQKLFLSVLNIRSKLGNPEHEIADMPVPSPPESGHFSSKIALGMGYRNDSAFNEIRWRPAYHDLLDSDKGFVEGYQINFFDVSARYYYNYKKMQLAKLNFIDILSISPRDEFLKPFSWKATTGFVQKNTKDGKEHLIYQLNTGGGLAYKKKPFGLFYGLLQADLNAGWGYKNKFVAGAGTQVGIIAKISDSWKFNLSEEMICYGFFDSFMKNRVSFAQTLSLNKKNSFNLIFSWEQVHDTEMNEMLVNWNYYF
jgi:hypothetical protein